MDNQNLENRIKQLEDWKVQREKQQITFPLDIQSINILNEYFMRITGEVNTIAGAGSNEFTYYIGKQGNQEFQVDADTFIPYTVDSSTDVFTIQKISFDDNTQIYVSTSDTTPDPLVAGDPYFVVSSTGFTFKLSLTSGGAPIDITSNGVGKQYIYYY